MDGVSGTVVGTGDVTGNRIPGLLVQGEQTAGALRDVTEPLNSCFTHSNNKLIICPSSLWQVRDRERDW